MTAARSNEPGLTGTFTTNFAIFGNRDYSDEMTPTLPARPAFLDHFAAVNGLTVQENQHKIVFVAFPLEVINGPANRAKILNTSLLWLLKKDAKAVFLPVVDKQ